MHSVFLRFDTEQMITSFLTYWCVCVHTPLTCTMHYTNDDIKLQWRHAQICGRAAELYRVHSRVEGTAYNKFNLSGLY